MCRRTRPSGRISTSPRSSAPTTNVAGELYFRANVRGAGLELCKSDGTRRGTRLVRDIFPGPYSSTPRYLTPITGGLLFRAITPGTAAQLWRSDGTPSGTTLVKHIGTHLRGGPRPNPSELTRAGHEVFFTARTQATGTELWKTDGTKTGTQLVRDIDPGSAGSAPDSLTAIGDEVLFKTDGASGAAQIWESDGSRGGTRRVLAAGNSPSSLRRVGHRLLFWADDAEHGNEPWKYRPQIAGAHHRA